MDFTEGQKLVIDITSEGAHAWAKTMLKTLRSYPPREARAVMVAVLANTAVSLSNGDAELLAVASDIISKE
jgi:truncated hemoglobin YjbI